MWIQHGKLLHAQGVTNPCVYSFGKHVRLKEQGHDLGRITLLALFMPQKHSGYRKAKEILDVFRSRLKTYKEIEVTELRLELSITSEHKDLIVFTDRGYAICKSDDSLVFHELTTDVATNFGLRNTARFLIRMGAEPSSAIAFAYRTKIMVGYDLDAGSRAKRYSVRLTVSTIVRGLLKVFSNTKGK